MQDQIEARLESLQGELEKGHLELQRVEAQRTALHETILRIEGAIQVLKELADGHPDKQTTATPNEIQHMPH